MIVEAVTGIGEVVEGDDVAELIIAALVPSDHVGDLRDGDVVVITSKIVSKAEGRRLSSAEHGGALAAERVRTVARRGSMSIVTNRLGITQASAGIDNSNVDAGQILLLPVNPDASAADIRARLERRFDCRLAVIISDTSGRAWRNGQTDHAIGLAGLVPMIDYAGTTDGYGNALAVTSMAVADELAAAADLVKGKLRRRPVAIIRGAEVELGDHHGAGELIRDPEQDLFARGQREAVLWALLRTLPPSLMSSEDLFDRFERLVESSEQDVIAELCDSLDAWQAAWVIRLLGVFGSVQA